MCPILHKAPDSLSLYAFSLYICLDKNWYIYVCISNLMDKTVSFILVLIHLFTYLKELKRVRANKREKEREKGERETEYSIY